MTGEELAAYISDQYGVLPDHPFPRDEVSAVFRHPGSRKWFALYMRVPYRTLGMRREGSAEILNIKCDPLLIGSLRGKPGFLPAYHMNKDKWVTVLLDGFSSPEDIAALLALSYRLTSPKPPRGRKTGKE